MLPINLVSGVCSFLHQIYNIRTRTHKAPVIASTKGIPGATNINGRDSDGDAINYDWKIYESPVGSNALGVQKCAIQIQCIVKARVITLNSTIAETTGYRIFVDCNSCVISSFSNNKIDNNDAAPMLIAAENTYALNRNSEYTGNGVNAIEVAYEGYLNVRAIKGGTLKNAWILFHFLITVHFKSEMP
jgi:hypothetical protein